MNPIGISRITSKASDQMLLLRIRAVRVVCDTKRMHGQFIVFRSAIIAVGVYAQCCLNSSSFQVCLFCLPQMVLGGIGASAKSVIKSFGAKVYTSPRVSTDQLQQ